MILSQNPEDIETAVASRIAPRGKLRHLGNGIDLTRFSPETRDPRLLARKRAELGIRPGQPVVGFVGRLVAEKGILEFLAAAKLVLRHAPDARFLIIGPGDGEKADALTPDVAGEFGIAQACVFTGMRTDMPDLYSLMDVFVLPSHREGFPRSPMEACAMRVPCVVTDIRGCRETVEHGRNGWLVPLGDVSQLAAAVAVLLGNPDMAAYMGRQARSKALRDFDERLVFQRVLAEYRRLSTGKLGAHTQQPDTTDLQSLGAIAP